MSFTHLSGKYILQQYHCECCLPVWMIAPPILHCDDSICSTTSYYEDEWSWTAPVPSPSVSMPFTTTELASTRPNDWVYDDRTDQSVLCICFVCCSVSTFFGSAINLGKCRVNHGFASSLPLSVPSIQ